MTDALHHPRLARLLLTASVALAVTGAAAAAPSSAVGVPPEQRLREELRAVVAELIEAGAFGDRAPQDIALDVEAPAQRVSNLGVLVDSASDSRDGLHVLGVTPGGSGERMGLRGGDVLVAANGTPLTGGAGQAATLRHLVDALPDGGTLTFDVLRGGRSQKLSGTLSSVYLPAMHLSIGGGGAAGADPKRAPGGVAAAQGCGRISDFDVAPRQQNLHAAKIISIDGRLPGPTDANAFRVEAGTHTVQVAEKIEPRYLSFNDRLRNSGRAGDRYKTLTVDVPPDTTVLIAARLDPDKRNEWQGGAYWDPVAWKQTAEPCR
jgi:hypothetical protein